VKLTIFAATGGIGRHLVGQAIAAGAETGAYRTAHGRNLRRGLTVSRADVAHLMLAALGQPETIGQTIGIAN
jgi:uncharacterized protein YbjT (DUF2867 family)